MEMADKRGISLTAIMEDPAWELPYWVALYEIKAVEHDMAVERAKREAKRKR